MEELKEIFKFYDFERKKSIKLHNNKMKKDTKTIFQQPRNKEIIQPI